MLTITRMQGDQAVTVTVIYNLDGSETKNTVQGRGGPQEQVSKATWDGNKLVIVQTQNFGGNTVEQKRVMWMEGGNPRDRADCAKARRWRAGRPPSSFTRRGSLEERVTTRRQDDQADQVLAGDLNPRPLGYEPFPTRPFSSCFPFPSVFLPILIGWSELESVKSFGAS